MKEQMRDRAQVEQLIARGLRAMQANNVEELRAVNRLLVELLTVPLPDSTVIRW
mgnify:FL=1